MGEAETYFQSGQGGGDEGNQSYNQPGYNQGQGSYNQAPNQSGYNQGPGMEYQKPPPEQPPFSQPPQQYGGPPPSYGYQPPQPGTEKYSFDDAFKVEKPKWNDLWAGILVG